MARPAQTLNPPLLVQYTRYYDRYQGTISSTGELKMFHSVVADGQLNVDILVLNISSATNNTL